jgi:pyruvate/2-oxoglutarate dehydrogenase complex dihydrolipoamide dehydrogenase (E3) component
VEQYDVVVIGGGSAGENIVERCVNGGLSVAVVERELVGGECSYWACMPSKTLIRPGEVLAAARRVPGAREAVDEPIDVPSALARRDDIVGNWDDEGQVRWVEGAGGTLHRGRGRLAGARCVEIESIDGRETTTIEARLAVVLATGSVADVPSVPGLDKAAAWNSRAAVSARAIPGRLGVLGGGAVGTEMAQAFSRLGSRVTVIERGPRLLANLEPFAGDEIARAFADEDIEVLTDAEVVSVDRAAPDAPVTVEVEGGRTIEADELLVAVGRLPSTADVGLDTIGLEPGKAVEVDDRMRATGVDGDWLYAVGDVNGRVMLTHMGKYQARIAADVILGRDITAWANGRAVPSVVFTDPQVGSVGLTEARAKEAGIDVRTVEYELGNVAAAGTHGVDFNGKTKLVVDEERRVVVGATFVGPEVAELLHSATIAVAGEVSLETLWHAVPSFPTLAEVWLRLLEAYGL